MSFLLRRGAAWRCEASESSTLAPTAVAATVYRCQGIAMEMAVSLGVVAFSDVTRRSSQLGVAVTLTEAQNHYLAFADMLLLFGALQHPATELSRLL